MLQQIARVAARGLPGAIAVALVLGAAALLSLALAQPAFAQTSPFLTGATALESNILAWLTPIAIILVMVLGGMAMANRISWGWCIGRHLGDRHRFRRAADRFWVRGMFGV